MGSLLCRRDLRHRHGLGITRQRRLPITLPFPRSREQGRDRHSPNHSFRDRPEEGRGSYVARPTQPRMNQAAVIIVASTDFRRIHYT
jgi:hypothetical protein